MTALSGRSVCIGTGAAVSILMIGGCRPSDVLSVPPPAGVIASGIIGSQAGAEAVLGGARAQLFQGIASPWYGGVLEWEGFLTDELVFASFTPNAGLYANVDARVVTGGAGYFEYSDAGWQTLMKARASLELVTPALEKSEPSSGRAKVGEAFALVGYDELVLAEAFCAGTVLDRVVPGGGFVYGTPLTTDSLLAVAERQFDSAIVYGAGDGTVEPLARVGLGRALLGRGQFAAADTAVASVPTNFVYTTVLAPGFGFGSTYLPALYADAYATGSFDRFFNVGDHEGGNGLNFRSAQDPRLTFDTTQRTGDGETWFVPLKFEVNNMATIPIATGVEARLIEAEAALKANQPLMWAADLRALRRDTADTHVAFPAADSLPADSAELAPANAQVDLMFRERAFWLYGTGTRLGDLRRLIRQYGRDQSTVFPTGPYLAGPGNSLASTLPSPLSTYGTDVTLTLPTSASSGSGVPFPANPNYKGCVTSTKTA